VQYLSCDDDVAPCGRKDGATTVKTVNRDMWIICDVDVVVVGATVACQIDPPGGWCGAVEDFDVPHLTFGPLVDHSLGCCLINLSHVPARRRWSGWAPTMARRRRRRPGRWPPSSGGCAPRPDGTCAAALRFLERIHDECGAHPGGQFDVHTQRVPPGPAQATILSRTTMSCQVITTSPTTPD
jgi:hypothetical protein